MNLISLLQFCRVLLVSCFIFIAIPLMVGPRESRATIFHQTAAGFVRVCLFFELTVLALGWCGLNFSGILTAAFILWISASILLRCRERAMTGRQALRAAFLRALIAVERGWRRDFSVSRAVQSVSPFLVVFSLLVMTTLFQRAWFPLHNFRFSSMETYSRVLSLQQFIHGDAWRPDGSVALFAPLILFSGLQADSVIRLAGPMFAALGVLATGFCAFRFLRSSLAAYVACAFAAVFPLFIEIDRPVETTRGEMSAIFWVLAVAFAGYSWRLAGYAAATALLISWHIGPAVGGALVSVLLGAAAVRLGDLLPVWWRATLGAFTAMVFTVALCARFDPGSAEGPFQYESAARASFDIARHFRRNDWLIVSPVHELAFTYGRGWHMELLDFVTSFTASQVSSPQFSLPYPVRDVFIFIEKEPLHSFDRIDLTQTIDRAVLAYGTGTGRASVQFQAAALVSAYASSHSDLSTFYEDDRLVIYRVGKEVSNGKSGPRA